MRAAFFGLLGMMTMVAGSSQAAVSPLAAWRWHSRILILFAPSDTDPQLVQQQAALNMDRPASRERDLVRIDVVGQAAKASSGEMLDAATMRHAYGVADGSFAVILVGKDGGEKLRSARPIEPSRLFRVIDAMPMRRQEASRPSTHD